MLDKSNQGWILRERKREREKRPSFALKEYPPRRVHGKEKRIFEYVVERSEVECRDTRTLAPSTTSIIRSRAAVKVQTHT
jgi:hypothetical protein